MALKLQKIPNTVIILITLESISRYSPNPPQTPNNILSEYDLVKLFILDKIPDDYFLLLLFQD